MDERPRMDERGAQTDERRRMRVTTDERKWLREDGWMRDNESKDERRRMRVTMDERRGWMDETTDG